jgi:Na+/H+-dicarboxylate symporter
MAEQKVLPTLIFSVAFGVCLGRLGPQARPMTELLESLARAMLLLTRWIVAAAPLAMFVLMARLAATEQSATLLALARLVAVMYLGVAAMALFFLAALRAAGEQPLKVLRVIREPLLLAFMTRSMEVAFPLQLQRLEDLAVPNRIAAIILPLGYSFNLTGSAMYVACVYVRCGHLQSPYGHRLSLHSVDCDAGGEQGDRQRARRRLGGALDRARDSQLARGRDRYHYCRRCLPRYGPYGN